MATATQSRSCPGTCNDNKYIDMRMYVCLLELGSESRPKVEIQMVLPGNLDLPTTRE